MLAFSTIAFILFAAAALFVESAPRHSLVKPRAALRARRTGATR